jgi:hypothetical protein
LREAAQERFPDDDLAAKIAAREAFDAKEATYAADLDAQVEEQDILDMAHASTCLRGELHEELRAEGSGAAGDRDKEEYVHLEDDDLDDDFDADDLAYLDLPTNEETTKAAADF